ncbi:hypothetical protein [Rhodococcus sp. RD6.2]|jgi:hypothetical protein|uniref:hypothetical protein n=1 Tax=Rhodococcus sp. RD6.2 TaxID=260936 RepID=UPI000B113447|nr:hypothetical protein [Rhodococcus sp. RD6.2]
MTTAAMLGRFFLLLIAAATFASAVAVWRRQKMAPTRAEFVSVAALVLSVSMLT